MRNRLALAALLLAAGAVVLSAEEVYYQVDLLPSGKLIAKDPPMQRGTTVTFHKYPDGTLISMRRSDIRQVTKVSAQSAVSTNPAQRVVTIGNLAMQGAAAQAGAPAGNAAAGARPVLGKGFYSAVVPGQTQGLPNSPNDYQVGRTFAGPPSNAVQSSPGAPPMNPSANQGVNPPTMNAPPPPPPN